MGLSRKVFEFIGAVSGWIYGSIWRTVFTKKKYSFREYMHGPDDSDDWIDRTGHSFVNLIIGFAVIMLIVVLLSSF